MLCALIITLISVWTYIIWSLVRQSQTFLGRENGTSLIRSMLHLCSKKFVSAFYYVRIAIGLSTINNEKEYIVRITSDYFCAGITHNASGEIISAAPILNWMVGRYIFHVKPYCDKKGWLWNSLNMQN